MFVSFGTISLYIPFIHSLKEKRNIIRSIKDKVSLMNVSLVEVDLYHKWQVATLVLSFVRDKEKEIKSLLNKIEELIVKNYCVEIKKFSFNIEKLYEDNE